MEKMSDIIRREFAEGDDERDAGLTTPEDVVRWDNIVYAEELQKLCADRYVTEEFPPAYIMTADGDFLHDQAPVLYDKLKEKQVSCELHEYVGEEEKLGHVFHLNIKSEAAKKCNDKECRFFKRFIK